MDDYLLNAAYGGDKKRAPLTSAAAFDAQYKLAVGALMNSNANLKGVVANFPDVFLLPHFNAVPYNPIPLSSGKADTLNFNFNGYNQVLDAIFANADAFGISAEDKAKLPGRKIIYAGSETNAPIMFDEELLDIGPYLNILQQMTLITPQQRAALAPYEQVRQTRTTDVLPLSAGQTLGLVLNEAGTAVYGVTVPLDDRHVITPAEKDSINIARVAFNATVAATAALYPDRLAFADMSAGFQAIAVAGATIQNGVLLTYGVAPPTGMFSEDLLHPNSRGYAFISNIIVDAVNAKFGATVPHTNIARYSATALPIP